MAATPLGWGDTRKQAMQLIAKAFNLPHIMCGCTIPDELRVLPVADYYQTMQQRADSVYPFEFRWDGVS